MKHHTLVVVLAIISLVTVPFLKGSVQAAAERGGLIPASSSVGWMLVLPRRPNVLFFGVDGPKADPSSEQCSEAPMMSSDAGATWADLSAVFAGIGGSDASGCLHPIFSASLDGGSAYATVVKTVGGAPTVYGVLHTVNGLDWQPKLPKAMGVDTWTESAARPQRLYGSYTYFSSPDSGEVCSVTISVSDDGGLTSTKTGDPTKDLPNADVLEVGRLTADPRDADTVYATLGDCPDGFVPRSVMVSHDRGATWSPLPLPADVKGFVLDTNRYEPNELVARPAAGQGGDRWYVSPDQGKTWHAVLCPGAVQSACPLATVDNVFGTGKSYALGNDGIYAFQGGGPGLQRLPLSDRLPVPAWDIADMQAGTRMGDPVYLLDISGVLYRSDDAGKSWQRLAAGVLPTAQPASTAPGAIFVKATKHSVAPAFITTYRKLGSFVVGNPVTEAYWEGSVLTQDFEHMRLEVRGTVVTVGNLGSEVLGQVFDPDSILYRAMDPESSPGPNSATRQYFPQTHHMVSGTFLAYWNKHGGSAELGAPITSVFTDSNGDGSGRKYQMQYFQKVRLEYHPENKDPHFQILLGLLGDESLVNRGWAVKNG